jgi:hypothetical protein
MLRVQPLERAAARQGVSVPGCPEGDLRAAQGVEVERVLALGRRDASHLGRVLRQQRRDLRTVRSSTTIFICVYLGR